MSEPHPERYLYLRDLLAELRDTADPSARRQVLANVANFAYDPANAGHLLRLDAPRALAARLSDGDPLLRRLAAAAVCNLCLAPRCRAALLRHGLLAGLLSCLEESCSETVCYGLTSLLLLPVTDPDIWVQVDSERLRRNTAEHSRSSDRRVVNLAALLLRQLPPATSQPED